MARLAAAVFLLPLLAACGGPEPSVVGQPRGADAKPDAGTAKGIRYVGNADVAESELRRLDTWAEEGAASTSQDEVLTMNAERVQELYMERGNLDVKVDITDVVHDGAGKIESAALSIKEGKRYKIGALRVSAPEGGIAGPEHVPLPRWKSLSGDWFVRKQIKEDLTMVARAYEDQGYAAVSVDPGVTLHPENGTADITVNIERRTRATFHDVSVIGNHSVPNETVRKAFTFAEGDVFNGTKLEETKQRLFELFNKRFLNVVRSLEQDPSHVSVQFEVSEPGSEMPPPRPRAPCPAHVDIAALLEKHAGAFGSESAVRAALPRTFKGYVETPMRSGDTALYLDTTQHRLDLSLGGVDPFRPARLSLGAGVDKKGAWELGLSGEVVRLQGDVAAGGSFMGWLFRREYLKDAAKTGATAECRSEGDNTETFVTFRGENGEATRRLVFDAGTGEITGFEVLRRGVPSYGKIVTWGPAGADGVRWPLRLSVIAPIGNDLRFTSDAPGLACAAKDCTAVTHARMTATWPANGVTTVPFTFFENELFLRAKVDDREVWAVLDSGASLTSFDTTAPLGASARPVLSLWARGSTQGLAYGVSVVGRVSVGDLTFRDMPVASAPLSVLASGGAMRAEAILGIAFFQEAAVRVDYMKQTVTFARDASLLPPRPGRAVPTLATWDMLTGNATVGGKTAIFQLDTGNGNGLNIEEAWAKDVGLPGNLPIVQASALTGAGERVTMLTMFRVPKVTLGPVHYDDKLVQMNNAAPKSGLGGLIGNDLFARCDAVTFDPKQHTLIFHGTCDRPRTESKTGWHVERKDDDLWKNTPWIVAALLPGTAAHIAGIEPGDRLLEIDGKPATLDRASWNDIFYGAEGTSVPVVIVRKGEKRAITLTLRSILK